MQADTKLTASARAYRLATSELQLLRKVAVERAKREMQQSGKADEVKQEVVKLPNGSADDS